jgi:hypothetical protein
MGAPFLPRVRERYGLIAVAFVALAVDGIDAIVGADRGETDAATVDADADPPSAAD